MSAHFPEVFDRIKIAMQQRNMSMREVSLKAGRSAELVRNWDRRLKGNDQSVGASEASLKSVSEALGVSYTWLLTGEGAPGFDDEVESHATQRGRLGGGPPQNHISIRSMQSGRAVITADVDLEGLQELRRKLDALEILLT
jgi:transcriptional regulator with XRE-family HTH domain